MAKSADAFRTISEVADWLGVQTHVLRFWESKFSQIKPVKRAGNRRYYRPNDMTLIGGLQKLLHEDGMTIKGAQKLLREKGVKYVASLSKPVDIEDDLPQEDVTPEIAVPETDTEPSNVTRLTLCAEPQVGEEPAPETSSQLGFDLSPVSETSTNTASQAPTNEIDVAAIRNLRDEIAEIISRRKASN